MKHYIRYCDDFVLLHESKEFLEHTILQMGVFLREQLELELHPRKVIMRKIHQGVDFLGYVSLPHYRVLRTITKNRMISKIIKISELSKIASVSSEKSREILMSYAGMLSHCKSKKVRGLLKGILSTDCPDILLET